MPELDLPGATSTPAALLLRKTSRVFVPTAPGARAPSPQGCKGVRALEADLLGLGYTLSGPLQDALAALPLETLGQVGRFVFDTLRRLRRLEDSREVPRLELGAAPTFFAGLTDDPSLPEGSEGYALRFRNTDADRVKRLTAGDLITALRA